MELAIISWKTAKKRGARLLTNVDIAELPPSSSGERQALMGHKSERMTAHYTKTPSEKARVSVEKVAERVRGVVRMEPIRIRKHVTDERPFKLRVAGSSPAAPTNRSSSCEWL